MSTDDRITIEINGKPCETSPGSMIIHVADDAGINIPRFCYHDKLSIAANCRMCLVEVEGVGKPLPACATPVADGMKVHTQSPKALAAQKGVMEFLLINHPLDCPICDQGGECELQDIAMGYGNDVSRYTERKRVVLDKNIGPLISTDMTRCIHCTRCVRFGTEVAGMRELGATGRGENTQIGTFIEQSVDSELSGNVIDLCPVGALTSKPFRFRARAWELQQAASIAAHDCVGSNIYLHSRRGEVQRVVPKDNDAVNETWISDRDRYAYQGIQSEDRLSVPRIRNNGQWQDTDWQNALDVAAKGLQAVIDDHGAERIGALLTAGATTEEAALLAELTRGLGSESIDYRLQQSDFRSGGVNPELGCSLEALESVDAALLIGSNVRKEQPLINHRLRKAAMKQTAVMRLHHIRQEANMPLAADLHTPASQWPQQLAAIAEALLEFCHAASASTASGGISAGEVTDQHRAVAKRLHEAENAVILLGPAAMAHPDFAGIRDLVGIIADRATGVSVGYLPQGPNAVGCTQANALPGKGGMNAAEMLSGQAKGLILSGLEPSCDVRDAAQCGQALEQAQFVVALSAYPDALLEEHADVILPVSVFAETAGSFCNVAGQSQSFEGAVAPPGQARPTWKVLRVLGNVLGLDGFDYTDVTQVRDGLSAVTAVDSATGQSPQPMSGEGLERISDTAILAEDAVVRRASALQSTCDAVGVGVRLHPDTIDELGLQAGQSVRVAQGEAAAVLGLLADERVHRECAWVASGIAEHGVLGNPHARIRIEKA